MAKEADGIGKSNALRRRYVNCEGEERGRAKEISRVKMQFDSEARFKAPGWTDGWRRKVERGTHITLGDRRGGMEERPRGLASINVCLSGRKISLPPPSSNYRVVRWSRRLGEGKTSCSTYFFYYPAVRLFAREWMTGSVRPPFLRPQVEIGRLCRMPTPPPSFLWR